MFNWKLYFMSPVDVCDILKEIRGAALLIELERSLRSLPVFQNNANMSMRKVTRALSKSNTNAARQGRRVFVSIFRSFRAENFCSVMGW